MCLRYPHSQLQHRSRFELHFAQIRRLCETVVSGVPESICPGFTMSPRMAGTVSQNIAHRGPMGRQAGFVPMVASVRSIGSHDGLRRLGRLIFRLPSLLFINRRNEPARGLRWSVFPYFVGLPVLTRAQIGLSFASAPTLSRRSATMHLCQLEVSLPM